MIICYVLSISLDIFVRWAFEEELGCSVSAYRSYWHHLVLQQLLLTSAIAGDQLDANSRWSRSIEHCCESHHFAGSGSGSASRVCRSGAGSKHGSASISTKWKNELCFFPENFDMLPKKMKIMTPMTLIRKIKQCILVLLQIKEKQLSDFSTCL